MSIIEDLNMKSVYNAAAPAHIKHNELGGILPEAMKKVIFPVNVPSFLLRVALGEMSDVVHKGSRVSAEKIRNAGYEFVYPKVHESPEEIVLQSIP